MGPLAQSVERGADNAKVVSSNLTRTVEICLNGNFSCFKSFQLLQLNSYDRAPA